MKAALGLVAVMACGAARRPEPLVNAAPIEKPPAPEPVRLAAAARPALDLSAIIPDPTEQARWPLSVTAHPALEPRFNIASALAVPGVGWVELCRMGAQNRTMSSGHDLQRYLKAWCAAATGNTAEAFNQLAVIGNPIVSGMAPAVREDLANILVQNGDADAAEKLLMKAKVDDIEIFDLLAASYFEVGRNDDAAEINERAIDRQVKSSDAAKCHRYARRVILKHPSARPMYMTELDELGSEAVRLSKNISTDPECKQLDAELACWAMPAMHCHDYFVGQNMDVAKYMWLLNSYYNWPARPMSPSHWIELAYESELARPVPAADRFETVALLAGFEAARCQDDAVLDYIRLYARNLRYDRDHDVKLDVALDALLSADPDPRNEKRARPEHCHALDVHIP